MSRWVVPAALAMTLALRAGAQQPMTMPMPHEPAAGSGAAGSGAADAEHAADAAMSGMGGMEPGDARMLHMKMTPARRATRADSLRGAAILDAVRRDIVPRYGDVSAAVADGYEQFAPGIRNQPVYHYTKRSSAVRAAFGFDASKPTSLLYRDDASGHRRLVGVMYTAPDRLSERDLDARVPLGLARWHEHVNWCLPPRGDRAAWTRTANGAPVFGPRSPVATKEACDAVGGRFLPRIFGWMVHVNVADANPWADDHHGTQ